MSDWKDEARGVVFAAAHGPDPNMRPEYRIPKHRPWWQFWKPREWEIVRGLSRADWEPVAEAMREDMRLRVAVMDEAGAHPLANVYSPWVDKAVAERRKNGDRTQADFKTVLKTASEPEEKPQ